MSDDVTGNISALQHFSTGDGPGIRTTVFFKGCSLRCTWCHNPETQETAPDLMFFLQLCTACGRCVTACPASAHCLTEESVDVWAELAIVGEEQAGLASLKSQMESDVARHMLHEIDRSLCHQCGACVAVCPSEALQLNGMEVSLETVMQFVLADQDFYRTSGGGVTLSGGEPLLQPDFCTALARSCKENGIHVIIDTAGQVPWGAFEKVIPYTDTFYFDLKGACVEDYHQETGGDFDLILTNLARLVAAGAHVVACIVIIPGLNDDLAANERLSDVLTSAGVSEVRLLAYHQLGRSKYQALGRDYPSEQSSRDRSVKADSSALNGMRSTRTALFDGKVKPPDLAEINTLLAFYARSFSAWLDG